MLTSSQLLLFERREASAIRACFLLSQVPWSVLGLLGGFTSSSTALLSQNSENLGNALAEDSDLLEVGLCLRGYLLDAQLR